MTDNITLPRATVQQALEALEDLQRQYSVYPHAFWDWSKGRASMKALKAALEQQQTKPVQRKPLTDEQPVSNADELPSGFVPLQEQHGRLVYAACMDSEARHYKWLMWRHPDGQWVSKRKLEDWEVMQVEDQQHYGIVQKAAHGIKEGT